MNPIQRVIKRHRVHAAPAASRPAKTGVTSAPPPARKGARLVHVDGRLQAIEVTCACGETMVIEVQYENEYENVPEETVS